MRFEKKRLESEAAPPELYTFSRVGGGGGDLRGGGRWKIITFSQGHCTNANSALKLPDLKFFSTDWKIFEGGGTSAQGPGGGNIAFSKSVISALFKNAMFPQSPKSSHGAKI